MKINFRHSLFLLAATLMLVLSDIFSKSAIAFDGEVDTSFYELQIRFISSGSKVNQVPQLKGRIQIESPFVLKGSSSNAPRALYFASGVLHPSVDGKFSLDIVMGGSGNTYATSTKIIELGKPNRSLFSSSNLIYGFEISLSKVQNEIPQTIKQEDNTAVFPMFGGYPAFVGQVIDYDAIQKLIQDGKYEEALKLLRSYSINDDIFFSDFDDTPHYYRSVKRRLMIVRCLLALERSEEAKKELRSLFEVKEKPEYVVVTDALLLLIDLETTNDYDNFKVWLKKFFPLIDNCLYDLSIHGLIDIKKNIEDGNFEKGYEVLKTIQPRPGMEPANFSMRQQAVITYFQRNPNSLDYLLKKLEEITQLEEYQVDAYRGIIFSIGEMKNAKLIPELKKLKERLKNSYTKNLITDALAKSGDTEK